MACDGAKKRREGLIADMVKLRDSVQGDAFGTYLLNNLGGLDPQQAIALTLGYLSVVLDGLCAAVIALAGPCCEDCDDEPGEVRRTWCCGTSITQPHVSGCSFEPREDNSPWRAG